MANVLGKSQFVVDKTMMEVFFPVVSVVKNFQIEYVSHFVESGRIKSRRLSRLAPSPLAPAIIF